MIRIILFVSLLTCLLGIGHLAPQFGIQNAFIIVNGRDARVGELPYQASIQVKAFYGDASFHDCGAAIIDERHVLTAAHCFSGYSLPDLLVVAGVTDLSVPTDPNRVNLTIEQAYVHEDNDFFINDIALVRVATDFSFNGPYVQPIPLRTEQLEEPADCTVSGWGTTLQMPDPMPDVLQTLEVPFLDYELCEELYKDYEHYSIMPGMLCAGYLAGGKDACKNDSGGPLVCDGQLSGIVSWGNKCALPDYPGVYADVAYYREWIARALAQSYEDAGLLERHF